MNRQPICLITKKNANMKGSTGSWRKVWQRKNFIKLFLKLVLPIFFRPLKFIWFQWRRKKLLQPANSSCLANSHIRGSKHIMKHNMTHPPISNTIFRSLSCCQNKKGGTQLHFLRILKGVNVKLIKNSSNLCLPKLLFPVVESLETRLVLAVNEVKIRFLNAKPFVFFPNVCFNVLRFSCN